MKGKGRGSGPGRGQGQGADAGRGGGGGRGQGGGMGAGGSCLCPTCGRRFPHQQGVPCIEERCAECGSALIREGSAHHQEISQRRAKAAGDQSGR